MTPRVWVTRDEEIGGELSAALAAHGLEPVVEPVSARRVVAEPVGWLRDLRGDDWLVITSAFAARALAGLATDARVAAVGSATAQALRDGGFRVELVSDEASGASLWASLWPLVRPDSTVCYPRSSLADPPSAPSGVRLEAPVLYRTEPREFDRGVAQSVDVVALASPSAVERVADIRELPPCASIGPTTSAALRAHGIPVWLESGSHTFPALAASIADKIRPRAHP